nr:DUF5050 domain-containing protein [Evansella tamaricis]
MTSSLLFVAGCGDLVREITGLLNDIEELTDSSDQGDVEADTVSEGNDSDDGNIDEESNDSDANDTEGETTETDGDQDTEEEPESNAGKGVQSYGNYSGNINTQGGLYDIKGDYIFFANLQDNNNLYRMKLDGTELTQLTDHRVWSIHALQDWVYYIKLGDANNYMDYQSFNRVSLDGDTVEVVMDDPITQLHYYNGEFVFNLYSQFTKMSLDGDLTPLPYQGTDMAMYGEKFVFFGYDVDEGESAYYLGDIHGTEEQLIRYEGYGEYVFVEDTLFFTRGFGDEGLFKQSINETDSTLIIDDFIDFFNVDEDYIYYSTAESEATRENIRADHNGNNKVNLGAGTYSLNVFDSFIFGEFARQGYYSFYFIDKETNEATEIIPTE